MDQRVFFDEVRRSFDFLLTSYGFSVVREQFFPDIFGNGLVEFRSPDIGVLITLDRGQVLLNAGPSTMAPDAWFSLPTLQEHFESAATEKAYHFPREWDNYDDMVIDQIQGVADVFRRQCSALLASDFNAWNKLEELRTQRAEAKYRALTGKSLPRQQG